MKRWIPIIILLLACLVFANQAQARWWIFGKAEDTPEITSLFVGNTDIKGATVKESLLLDKSELTDGNVTIKGFARQAEAPLAVAKISLDDGQTWTDANIDKDTFVYQFAPEEGKEYKPQFKVMDTAGKESDVRELPQFTLVYKDVNVAQAVEEALKEMIQVYCAQDFSGFTRGISESYRGDMFALEEAIRSDFTKYDNLNIDVSVQQVTKSGNEAKIDFDFQWRAIKKSDGSMISPETGKTSYTFVQEGGRYKLLSMASPLIFGISRASEIQTGSLTSTTDATSSTLGAEDTYAASLPISTVTINDGYYIDFSTGTVSATASGDLQYQTGVWNPVHCEGTALVNAAGMSSHGLNKTCTLPDDSDAGWTGDYSCAHINSPYGVKDNHDKYILFEGSAGGDGAASWTIRYKYQTNGTRNFY